MPEIFGIKPVIVLSGSMSPAFEKDGVVTHRIVETVFEEGKTGFLTKGDANNSADRSVVFPNQVEGVYIGKLEDVGDLAMFLQSTTGMILFIICPVFLYFAWDIMR